MSLCVCVCICWWWCYFFIVSFFCVLHIDYVLLCFSLYNNLQSQHPNFNFTSHLKILKNIFNLWSYMLFKKQDIGECTDKAHVDVQLRISSFSQKCDLDPGKG